jgi:hypothetical protein
MTFSNFLVFSLFLPTGHFGAAMQWTLSKRKHHSFPAKQVSGEVFVSPEIPQRSHKVAGRGEESFNIRQSADQLDVQKNILLNGFDSSTENRTFFNVFHQKKEVAPFLVKNRNRCPPGRKIAPIKVKICRTRKCCV